MNVGLADAGLCRMQNGGLQAPGEVSTGTMSSNQTAINADRLDLEDFFENGTVGLHLVGSDGTILRANRPTMSRSATPPTKALPDGAAIVDSRSCGREWPLADWPLSGRTQHFPPSIYASATFPGRDHGYRNWHFDKHADDGGHRGAQLQVVRPASPGYVPGDATATAAGYISIQR